MSNLKNMPAAGFVVIVIIGILFITSIVMLFSVYLRYKSLGSRTGGSNEEKRGFKGALLKSYIDARGPQVQFKFVDAETLKQAKREPDRYRNLIVRIGGYCEYFVNLDSALQDEIITRTIHDLPQ